ncbi:GNAT family N-acetyltransferase [Rhodopila sp.]|uniref:GNAT family N-acetyltransferase n=1 Tax=Rhodopila sp. TaxID=2480087 RepID=UPI003D1361EA
MPIPTLTTDRLILRGFRASDWNAFAEMNADPRVRRSLGGRIMSREETWAQMETFLGQWALRDYGVFALEADGCFAGRVGLLHPVDWPEAELAWTLAARFWGRGLATEAAGCVRAWAFGQFGWDRLVSYIRPENDRSRRVAEKLGAVQEGAITLRGVVSDVWVHPTPSRGIIV